jgi:hypothetical protein
VKPRSITWWTLLSDLVLMVLLSLQVFTGLVFAVRVVCFVLVVVLAFLCGAGLVFRLQELAEEGGR